MILVIVAVAHILDTQIFGGGGSACRSAVIGFYLTNEGLSILEALNIPITAGFSFRIPENIEFHFSDMKEVIL